VDPVFGQLYWLTGNLLIDRNNRAKAHGTIAEVVNAFKKRNISSGCSRKGPAAAAAVCCRLKPARFMRLLRLACQLFRCAFQYIE
jgi:1-acyl-sn-glycerol-3-phosphate acyltransferase